MDFPSTYQTLTKEVIEARTLSQQPQGHVSTPAVQQLYSNLALPSSRPSIRLLHLHLAQDGDDSPLVGELSVVNIQNRPKFTTLSYAWGPAASHSLKLTIAPDNAELDITPNCYKALKQIRKLFGAVTIWVDAICINQANEGEKATQIALMQDIYALGYICYVWLGEGDETSKPAMEHLQFRARCRGRLPITYLAANDLHERDIECRKFKRNWWDDMICEASTFLIYVRSPQKISQANAVVAADRLKSKHIRYFSSLERLSNQEDFSRICSLFQSSWSYRMWTFQEIILSRHPVLICGDKTLEWEDLICALWLHGVHNVEESFDNFVEPFNNWYSMMHPPGQVDKLQPNS
ncbi:heterokaryon incompatibility protein-domain-containing protein [Nemania diffusa]|nr:heterokaryon incompatibility protein-domain-containing protein [Nemania diffusa]